MTMDPLSKAFRAFNTLSLLASGPSKPPQTRMPHCAKFVQEIQCKMCLKEFTDISGLVTHSKKCQFSSPDTSEFVRARTCCICGQIFPSEITKKMHLMSEKITKHCQSCLEPLDSEQEAFNHICTQNFVTLSKSDDVTFSCPLGCPTDQQFSSEMMEYHLISLHGCNQDEIDLDPVTKEVLFGTIDIMTMCPICNITMDGKEGFLNKHVVYHCNGRGRLQKELIKSIVKAAQESGTDCDLMVKIEMESQLSQWKMRSHINDPSHPKYLESKEFFDGADRDIHEKHPELSQNFFSGVLCFVPDQFSETFLGEKDLERDLPFLMQFWNHLIARSFVDDKAMAKVSADLFRNVRLELDNGEDEDDHEVPDTDLTKELEREIQDQVKATRNYKAQFELDSVVPSRKRQSPDKLSSESDKRPKP